MRVNDKKNYRIYAVSFVLAIALFLGCKPEKETARSSSEKTSKRTVSETPEAKAAIDLACKNIFVGDFSDAEEVIESSSNLKSAGLAQLTTIMEEYRTIEKLREQARAEAYQEYIEELEKIQTEADLDDVNDISKAFAAIIKVQRYADSERKQSLIESEFVKQATQKGLSKAFELEQQGDWIGAYAHSYYWLEILYEDNTDYSQHAEELLEKIMIETSLEDNLCETSLQRHEGIKPEMLLYAIRVLNLKYVSIVDYGAMSQKGLKRCKLLGEVLEKLREDVTFDFDAEKLTKWADGIESMQKELDNSFAVAMSDKFIKIFDEILALNSVTIRLPSQIVISQFSEAAFESLDPYTNMIWPWHIKSFEKRMTQDFTGIGIIMLKTGDVIKVQSLLRNTPAYFSGLDVKDDIIAVDGELTKDMSSNCAVSKITGPEGTDVTLTVRRADTEKTEDITITRARIVVPSIQGWQISDKGDWQYVIDPVNKIGYLRITSFIRSTGSDMRKVLDGLEQQGLDGLIIDLRDNSGGLLSSAIEVTDMFIESGPILKTQPRWSVPTYMTARRRGTRPNYPVAILINGRSASASEIVAGALQDPKHNRVLLVGSRSYGKGLVQEIIPIAENEAQFTCTTAYYHLPSGQKVKNHYEIEKQGRKDWGIMPDVEVELRRNEEITMSEVQMANEVLEKADHNDESSPIERHSNQETIEADPQLATALFVIRSKIVQACQVDVNVESKLNTAVVTGAVK